MHNGLVRDGETLDDLIIGGLRIVQPLKGYRFSIDAVLLAHFADLSGVNRAVDLGTGNGVLPLLLSQLDEKIRIVGLEIQAAMVDRANRSIRINNLQDRIGVMQADIRKLGEILPGGSAELVLSNPPFWKKGEGQINRNSEAAIARHEMELTLEELVAGAAHILSSHGKMALIHRASRLDEITGVCGQYGLYPSRVRMVKPYADRPANLVLMELGSGQARETEMQPPLIIYSGLNRYSDEIRRLYGAAR